MANVVQIVLQGKDNLSGVLRGVTGALGGFKSLLVATGVTVAAGTLIHLTKEAIDTADQMNLLAQRTGIAVDQLSALSYAAKLSDVDSGALQTAIKGLSKTMVEAGQGGADVRETLLGISDEFANTADGASKTARAVQLFGKSGQEMIPLLNQGKAALEEQFKEAEKFGQVVGPAFARNADMFNDNMDRLKSAFSGVFLQVADKVLPILVAYSEALVNLIKNSDLVERSVHLLSGVVTSMAKGVLLATEAWITFTGILTGQSFAEIGSQITAMEDDVAALTESLKSITAPDFKDAGKLIDPKEFEKARDLWRQLQISRMEGGMQLVKQEEERYRLQRRNLEQLPIEQENINELLAEAEAAHQQRVTQLKDEGLRARADLDAEFRRADFEGLVHLLNTEQNLELEHFAARQDIMQTYADLWRNSIFNLGAAVTHFFSTAVNSFSQGFGNAIANIATGTASVSQAFSALGKQMLASLVSFAAQLVINAALALVLQATIGKAALAVVAPLAVAWGAAATAASIATLGSAAAAGSAVFPVIAAGSAFTAAFSAGGIAHGGLDYVPEESTFLLNRGERVLQPQANQDLTAFLEGSGGGGPTQIAIYLDGAILGQGIGQLSRDGRLEISAKAIAA